VRDIIEDLKNVSHEVRYAIGGQSEEEALEEKNYADDKQLDDILKEEVPT